MAVRLADQRVNAVNAHVNRAIESLTQTTFEYKAMHMQLQEMEEILGPAEAAKSADHITSGMFQVVKQVVVLEKVKVAVAKFGEEFLEGFALNELSETWLEAFLSNRDLGEHCTASASQVKSHQLFAWVEDKPNDNCDEDFEVMESMDTSFPQQCPISRQPFTDPVYNETCKHIFDRHSIMAMLQRKTRIPCPQAACAHFVTRKSLHAHQEMKFFLDHPTRSKKPNRVSGIGIDSSDDED